jgi:toxin ParE1/3/4
VPAYREPSQVGTRAPDLKPNIRSFVVMSWIIFYRVDDDFVEIVRVLHSARDLDAIDF